jgi:hypothetical protein
MTCSEVFAISPAERVDARAPVLLTNLTVQVAATIIKPSVAGPPNHNNTFAPSFFVNLSRREEQIKYSV